MTRTPSPAAPRPPELFDHAPAAVPKAERTSAERPATRAARRRVPATGEGGAAEGGASPYSSPDARHSGIDGPLSSPISSKKSISFFAECRIISRRCPLSFTAATASAGFRPTLA